jgi:hypothetical protein
MATAAVDVWSSGWFNLSVRHVFFLFSENENGTDVRQVAVLQKLIVVQLVNKSLAFVVPTRTVEPESELWNRKQFWCC